MGALRVGECHGKAPHPVVTGLQAGVGAQPLPPQVLVHRGGTPGLIGTEAQAGTQRHVPSPGTLLSHYLTCHFCNKIL